MASNFLSWSAPVEIIIQILQSCDAPKDVLALAFSCRNIYKVWHANAATIGWCVWQRKMPCIDEALVAARATGIVMEAEKRGVLPPMDMCLKTLSGHTRAPGLSELKSALDLNHLAHALEVAFCHDGYVKYPFDNPEVLPESIKAPDRMPEWSARVRKAIFRALIVGAALAGVYNEPLFEADQQADPDLQGLGHLTELSPKQLQFVEKFAVCNMEATPEAEEDVFGSVGDWLLESILSNKEATSAMSYRFEHGIGRATCCCIVSSCCSCGICYDCTGCCVDLVDGGGSHSDAHLVCWEVMQMLWVYDHIDGFAIDRNYVNDEYESGYNAGFPLSTRCDLGVQLQADEGRPREAHDVFFGAFKSEEVTAPEFIDMARKPTIMAKLAVPAEAEATTDLPDKPWGPSVRSFFDWLESDESGRPNRYDECMDPVAPLTFKFFEYFLRRHPGLYFHEHAFHDMGVYERLYTNFIENLGIFAHDDVEDRSTTNIWGMVVPGVFDVLDGHETLIWSDTPPERISMF